MVLFMKPVSKSVVSAIHNMLDQAGQWGRDHDNVVRSLVAEDRRPITDGAGLSLITASMSLALLSNRSFRPNPPTIAV
jgi:hypothetical protein